MSYLKDIVFFGLISLTYCSCNNEPSIQSTEDSTVIKLETVDQEIREKPSTESLVHIEIVFPETDTTTLFNQLGNKSKIQKAIAGSYLETLFSERTIQDKRGKIKLYNRKLPIVNDSILLNLEFGLSANSDRVKKKFFKALDRWKIHLPIKVIENSEVLPITKIETSSNSHGSYSFCVFTGIHKLSFDASDLHNIVHEIGHNLGLFHEHQRPDRDKYMVFNGNVNQVNFGKIGFIDTLYPYDIFSIMSYQHSELAYHLRENKLYENLAMHDKEYMKLIEKFQGKLNFVSPLDVIKVRDLYFNNKYVEDFLTHSEECIPILKERNPN